MKKKIKYIILSIIVLIGCFLYAHVDITHDIYNSKIDTSLYVSAELNENQSVSQSFQCNEEHLDGVSIKVSINSVSPEGKLLYSLFDMSGNELISGEVPFEEIKSGRINKIMFNKTIENSKNKEYLFTAQVSGLKKGENLTVYYTSEEDSGIIVDGERLNGSMILRTVTHRFDMETFIVLIGFIIYFVVFFRFLYKLFS